MGKRFYIAKLLDIQVETLITEYMVTSDEGNPTLVIHHDNPQVNDKIDDAVPFKLLPITYEGNTRVLVAPYYEGPVPKTKQGFQELRANMQAAMPFILPMDGTYFEQIKEYVIVEPDPSLMETLGRLR